MRNTGSEVSDGSLLLIAVDDEKIESETKPKKDEKRKKENKKKTSQPNNSYRILDIAYAGMAVRIVPTYLEECVDPRPVGERIHFFSPFVLEVERSQEKLEEGKTGEILPLEKKKLENQAKEEALRARDEFIMEEELDNDSEDDTDEAEESNQPAEGPTEVIESKNPIFIIGRMRSDLDMGTFLDRYHDYRDYCAANKITAKIRVVQSGIGTISISDVQVGIAAGKNALILGYRVEIESFAFKDAKENQLKILMHENMPDLLQQVFGSYGSVSDDNLNGTGSDKKKKKKKKNKNKTLPVSNDKLEEKVIDSE